MNGAHFLEVKIIKPLKETRKVEAAATEVWLALGPKNLYSKLSTKVHGYRYLCIIIIVVAFIVIILCHHYRS